MKKRISRFLAGMLSVALILSSGSYSVFAVAEDTAGNLEAVESETVSEPDIEPEDTDSSQLPKANEEDAAEAEMPETNAEEQEDQPAVSVSEIEEEGGGENEISANETEPAATAAPVKGVVEVWITAGAPAQSDQEFQAVLTHQVSGDRREEKMILPRTADEQKEASRVLARFPELESGVWELNVTGGGYMAYTQEITVSEGLGCRAQLYTGKVELGDENVHPGLLVRGDVNGDGTLDQADANAIIDVIEATSGVENSGDGRPCDLNGDKIVDLLDLNYLTEYMAGARQKSTIETFVPKEAVSSVSINGQSVSADQIQELFAREQVVSLQPANADAAISAENPVTLEFDMHDSAAMMGGIVLGSPGENYIDEGEIIVQQADGSTETIVIRGGRPVSGEANAGAGEGEASKTSMMTISLKGMVAVKKVTFRITKTSNAKNLAEISTVEFLNDMEKRIPEPDMNIPQGLTAVPGNKMFSLSWKRENNVTAYEIRIENTPEGADQPLVDYQRTTQTALDVSQFNKDKMHNKVEYRVSVQALNGEWKSGFSQAVTVVPRPTKKPPKPDRVTAKGGYRSLTVGWTNMEDEADKFFVYYRKDVEETFTEVEIKDGSAVSYTIENLPDDTKYYVYVVAYNDKGRSEDSLIATDKTLAELAPVEMPEYKLINTSNGEGKLSSHIKSAVFNKHAESTMVDSPLDDAETRSALGLFDNNFASYVECDDWDWGAAYPANGKGITVELDKAYSIGMITLAEPVDIGTYTRANIRYWDASGSVQNTKNTSIITKTVGGRKYYLIKFDEINTAKVQIGIGRFNSPRKITVSEIRFHAYDSIEQDILDLYQDDLHSTLKDNVDTATFTDLQKRLDTPDPSCGELHPEKDALQLELDTARELYNTKNLGGVTAVNPNITHQGDVGVGGLNPWQPLGVAAAADDEIVVYVSNPKLNKGANTSVSLVFTQYHAESGGFFKSQALKIGRNQITVPKISSTDVEKGGALYVQYSGNNRNDKYAVRVSGGVKFPVLNVYGVPQEERAAKIEAYVKELNEFVPKIESEHGKVHKDSGNENVDYAYDATNCIANSTDIVMDQMMLSIPASQALAGLGKGTEASQVSCLTNSIRSMEEMLILFYQHKGLTNSFDKATEAYRAKNHLPYRYLNIRYMRMFAGAFMYASGNHIGIEWGSTPGMTANSTPVTADEKGKWVSGGYFGWGIAHEIGHDINEGSYSHAEITNNYFSVLAQAKDTNDSVRFQYDNVFKKVTSGTKGYASNVFTQLGMYWQLHLAYDKDYNYTTYDTYQEMFDNLLFARIDTYSRDTSRAPKPGGIALTLPGDRDQNIMRLASAAAERDLSDFFDRWGMTPTKETTEYMAQFPKETRTIYYGDDEARAYKIEGGNDNSISGNNVVTASVSQNRSDVTVNMQVSSSVDKTSLQGYEITRVYIDQGEERRETAGFTRDETFTDHVPFASNRVITYEVTAVGKCLNRSQTVRTDAVKIDGEGLQDKSDWTISSNMTSKDDYEDDGKNENEDEDRDTSCSPVKVPATQKIIDNSTDTTYVGKSAATEDPYIILELNQSTEVNALSYTCKGTGTTPVTEYKIEVSTDGTDYKEVKTGTFTLNDDGEAKVFLENGQDKWICTYDASFVKLTAVGQAGKDISITEVDLYGPSGDNVEFLTADGQTGIGILASDYVYEESISGNTTSKKIPAGSIVFTGEYKGNPAYNVTAVYDQSGKIVGGIDANGDLVAHQIVLAPKLTDDQAMLGETSDGRWIYWIEPDDAKTMEWPQKVRAELYRVDNALTNEGQRLVSDTKFVDLPKSSSELPSISLEAD